MVVRSRSSKDLDRHQISIVIRSRSSTSSSCSPTPTLPNLPGAASSVLALRPHPVSTVYLRDPLAHSITARQAAIVCISANGAGWHDIGQKFQRHRRTATAISKAVQRRRWYTAIPFRGQKTERVQVHMGGICHQKLTF